MTAGPLIVIETLILDKSIPSNNNSISLSELMATPHMPTSPSENGWSAS